MELIRPDVGGRGGVQRIFVHQYGADIAASTEEKTVTERKPGRENILDGKVLKGEKDGKNDGNSPRAGDGINVGVTNELAYGRITNVQSTGDYSNHRVHKWAPLRYDIVRIYDWEM